MSTTEFQNLLNEVTDQLGDLSSDAERWAALAAGAASNPPVNTPPSKQDPAVDEVEAPQDSSYSRPLPVPVAPNTSFTEPTKPDGYLSTTINRLSLPNDPNYTVDFSDVFSTYEPGNKPNLPTYTAPTVTVPVIDPAPVIEAPDDILLTNTVAPTFAGLTPIDLSGIAISPYSGPHATNTFNFVDDPFAPDILIDIIAQARTVLSGSGFLANTFWDSTWSQQVGNLKRQELAAIREAKQIHGASGWIMPGIVGNAGIDSARQKASEAISDITHKLSQEQIQRAHDDITKAAEIGFQCEQLLLQAHTQGQERALRSAVESNNAGIAVAQAAAQLYQITELAAKEFLIKLKDLELRGDQLELQEFEAELKAAGFNLEYDKNQVELYKAQWSGQETRAKAYQAYADAIRSYVQGQGVAVDAFKSQVESNNTILQGWAIEWDAYLKRLKPAELRIQAYQARDGHYGKLVQKYDSDTRLGVSQVESDIKVEQLRMQNAQQQLDRYKVLWEGIQAKLDALTKVYATDAQVYTAKAQAETSRVQSLNQRYELDIQKAQLTLNARIEGLKTNLGYWDRWMQTWVQWQASSTSAYAQIGAAAYAAANYSLSASGSLGFTSSENLARGYTVSISGDADENNYDVTPPLPPAGEI